MSQLATGRIRPLYVGGGAQHGSLGLLHEACAPRRGTAVLMLPPFGWDDVASYRSRRDWAADLARHGYATLRLHLPGTGDSAGGPRDPACVDRWVAGVDAAARWLRVEGGAASTVAIGLGLGGLLACLAVAQDAPIDDLVLWAVPARGRRLVRELRAFARLEGADAEGAGPVPGPAATEAAPEPLGDDALHAGGFLLTAETLAALERIDLAALPVPGAPQRRALLLERDGTAPDAQLRAHLEDAGVRVEVLPGAGYGEMTVKPHEARAPREAFATVRRWLDGGDPTVSSQGAASCAETEGGLGAAAAIGADATAAGAALELDVDGAQLRERVLDVAGPAGRLFGILAEPAAGASAPVCAVLLNAGAISHIGPSRMWVEAARRWAARGVPTLRLDLSGLGDAEGEDGLAELEALYDARRVAEVRAALDALEADGFGPRFLLGGLCSGAYWAFHAAVADERVRAAALLNPRALTWEPSLERLRELRAGVRDPRLWGRALRGDIPLARVVAIARWAPLAPLAVLRRSVERRRARRSRTDPLETSLDRLEASDTRVLLAFSGREPLHEELARERRLEALAGRRNVELTSLPGAMHTLRSPAAQRAAHASLDRALTRELERAVAARVA